MTVATLYSAHRPYVLGVVRTLGVSEADVEDLTQEVFGVLLRRPLALTDRRGARRWLYQAARRVVSNHRRARRREEQRRRWGWAPPEGPCPEAEAMRGQARERLAAAVAALPAEARALHRYSEVQELPGPEVARRLGLNPNTTYARVRALRRRLLQALVVVALLLAALLASQLGCAVEEKEPSSAVTRAATPMAGRGAGGEATDDRRRTALRGPALGFALAAAAR